MAIMKQRSSYEQLYGYGGAPATEQFVQSDARGSPWLSHALTLRAGTLSARRQHEIRTRLKVGGGGGGHDSSGDGARVIGGASSAAQSHHAQSHHAQNGLEIGGGGGGGARALGAALAAGAALATAR